MPKYDYMCKHCGEMEIEQSIKENALTECPKCGSNLFKKMVSKNTSILFKGSGFYDTDYKIKKGDKE
jgi:putative FmdB family regulatory protein